MKNRLKKDIYNHLVNIASETNGITLADTLELSIQSLDDENNTSIRKTMNEFNTLLTGYVFTE